MRVKVKFCGGCQEYLTLDHFAKNKSMKDRLQTRCKKCRKKYKHKVCPEYSAKWSRENKEKIKGYKLKSKYGIDLATYEDMYEKANGRCEICKEEFDSLCVDHCHNTLEVRGVLCFSCNVAIGHFKDNKKSLESAIKYLDKQEIKNVVKVRRTNAAKCSVCGAGTDTRDECVCRRNE